MSQRTLRSKALPDNQESGRQHHPLLNCKDRLGYYMNRNALTLPSFLYRVVGDNAWWCHGVDGHTPDQCIRRCHPYARKSATQAVLSMMQLALHATRQMPHSASPLTLAMSTWSLKTRIAPPRHCRDSRVYGHTTMAMHVNEYTPRRDPPRHSRDASVCGHTTTAMHDIENPLPPFILCGENLYSAEGG